MLHVSIWDADGNHITLVAKNVVYNKFRTMVVLPNGSRKNFDYDDISRIEIKPL